MGVFGKRSNKKFSYTPRYYKGEGSPYAMKHKFDEHRSTIETPSGVKGRFKNAWDEHRNSPKSPANKRVLYICIILLVLFLYFIDFDLSIFLKK